jgi:hypothetical protein
MELDRPEEHEDAGPVRDEADHTGEQRDADQIDQQLVVHRGALLAAWAGLSLLGGSMP